jgi:hypothetical protein
MLEDRFTVQQEGGAGQPRIRLEFVGTNVGAKLIHKMKMGYAY